MEIATEINNTLLHEIQELLDKGAYGEIVERLNNNSMKDQIKMSSFWGDLFLWEQAGDCGSSLGESGAGCCCCCCGVAGVLGVSYVCTGGFGVGCDCLSDTVGGFGDICCGCFC